MILLQQCRPSVSVFSDTMALNSFQILYCLVLSWMITNVFVLKTILRELALFEFQENFLCFINSIFFMLENLCIQLSTFLHLT